MTKDVPNYAIVAGSPARIIKYRFSEEIIQLLNEVCWWDLPISVIKENIDLFKTEPNLDSLKKLKEMRLGI